MKPFLVCLCLLISFGYHSVSAQDTFEEWKRKHIREFREFKDARDKEFMKMLNATWKAIGSDRAEEPYEEPKPVEIPKLDKPVVRLQRASDEPVIEDIAVPEPDFGYESQPAVEITRPTVTAPGYRNSEMDFFDVRLAYSYPPEFDINLGYRVEKSSISRFWSHLGSANYRPLLEQSRDLKEILALNDWGYALVLYRMGQDIYGARANESVLFTWFMMTKAGYRAKVGYDQRGVYLLMPTGDQLFNTKFFRIDGVKHYALMLDNAARVPSSIFTYDGTYPQADRIMELDIKSSPRVKKSLVEKKFSFDYNGVTYDVPVRVNRNVIAFYELYPLTELNVYFNAPVSPDARSSLLGALAPVIEGKSETEAVNILLRFVQTAFEYKTDQQQFGYEKYLLPEETLYYPYSDCDDRTIMFAILVRELVGLDVVGVRYPKHLAAAVKFSKVPEGDYVTVAGERYTVADPTFENANIGVTMPQYRNQKPEILAAR